MERQVIFRDNQEQQAVDHNDLQSFARMSLDHIVNDAVTRSRRYAGFATVKSSQAEVTVAPGRFFDQGGAIFVRGSSLVQSMVPYLAAASQRIVTLAVSGVENETNVQERDFLVNAETMQVEPDAVAMTRSRDAVLTFIQGAESADPQPPAIPATHVAIAYILLDPTQVVSITMVAANAVASTEDLDLRARQLEEFRQFIGPRVGSLASDLADLAGRTVASATRRELLQLYTDVARLKEIAQVPDDHSDYGADHFLGPQESDWEDTASLGFDAKVEEGLRFPDANAAETSAALFNPNDPNATLANGMLLPKYTSELKISTGEYHSDLALGQFGFQTHELVQKSIRKERIRYGGGLQKSSTPWSTNKTSFPGETAPYWLTDFETWPETVTSAWENPTVEFWGGHKKKTRTDTYWHDSWTETYWEMETVDHTITGAQVAQPFLVANDMWMTRLGFYVTSKAANEAIHVTVCEMTGGAPDLKKVILHQTHAANDIVVGWNRITVPATYLEKGRRYAVLITANANHAIGMAHGQSYLEGTFSYTTDGVYYLGDLTKNMMLEIWGASFANPQVTLELAGLSLDGGMRTIDILANMIIPEACELVFEVRPNGSGSWLPLSDANAAVLTGAPPLCQFRARFIGTRDIMPGLLLTGSRVRVSRPKTSFRHVSTEITLAAASETITVVATVEGFDDTPHDFAAKLRVGSSTLDADAVVAEELDASFKRWRITSVFELDPATDTFRIILEGTTNSPSNTFAVSERIHYAT